MAVDLEALLAATGGRLLEKSQTRPIRQICTDTRLIGRDDMFFALCGKNFDGHDFVEEAIAKGAGHCVISSPSKIRPALHEQANFIVVPDVLKAYGDWARAYRRNFRIPIVAITGSSGKTTVKELIAHLLSAKYRVLKNRGTENNLVGVPKTLLQLDANTEVAVLELGTNAPGEIDRLASIVRPTMGVLTLIGYSHLEGLKSLEGVLDEKCALIKHIDRGGSLLLNGEDPRLNGIQSGVHRVERVGYSPEGRVAWAKDIHVDERGAHFLLNGKTPIETKLLGRHNVLNALLAIECAMLLDVDMEMIQRSIATFKPVPGRMTPKEIDNVLFIDDTYNANPTSFGAALTALTQCQAPHGRKFMICGDMLELGPAAHALHEEAGRQVQTSGIDTLIVVGTLAASIAKGAMKDGFPEAKIIYAKDSLEAGNRARALVRAGDVVMVKGSRGMQMERVFDCFTNCSIR